jgi:AcrR family transcriptional regulator
VTGNRWISDLHWVREGQQTRSQKTQEALLDAAEALFFEQGADATSVADVAEKAGCSVGSVYHHFRDKKAMLYALYDRMSQEFQQLAQAAVDPARWEDATITDVLRGYAEFSLQMGKDRPGFKLAVLAAANSDQALRQHYHDMLGDLYTGLSKLLLARRTEIGHPKPKLAVAFVLDQLGSMLRARLDTTQPRGQLSNVTDKEFTRQALLSAQAYLQLPLRSE